MKIFAIADLHLSFNIPEKSMEFFGPTWAGYTKKIEDHWRKKISKDDLVLIAGDISWAIDLKDAIYDLNWIDSLPGTKVLIKGNHDYWWGSLKKIYDILPPSIHLIQNNTYTHKNITIGGTRLWDTAEFSYAPHIEFQENPRQKEKKIQEDLQEKIFQREILRLRLSLDLLDKNAPIRIIMTHYPPIGPEGKDSIISKILEEYGIDFCIFGHLHNMKKGLPPFKKIGKTKYFLTSCDYLNFDPVQIIYK